MSGGAPDVTATRRNVTLKYGFGMNAEQEITGDIGVTMERMESREFCAYCHRQARDRRCVDQRKALAQALRYSCN